MLHIKLAIKQANKAKHQQRLAAVLVRGGKLISVAHNYSHVHAECAALNRARRGGADGAVLAVVRIRRDGTLGMARPCNVCMRKLIGAGVKKVIYSCSDGTFRSEKVIYDPRVVAPSIKFRSRLWYKQQ